MQQSTLATPQFPEGGENVQQDDLDPGDNDSVDTTRVAGLEDDEDLSG